MDINGSTKIAGIFGFPIEHTLSPYMHNSAFNYLGHNSCYVAFEVSPERLPEAVKAVINLNMLGVNITVPHKEKVIPLLDDVDEEALFIGAVNTVTNTDGILKGYNTDGRGFISSLSEEDVSIDNKEILIIGAGGASRAVSYYLSKKASAVSIFDIDLAKAGKLVSDLSEIRENVRHLKSPGEAVKADIIINATPLGLKDEDPLPVDIEYITAEMTVCDLVYKNTVLLKEAKRIGAKTINGSGMLLWQGVLAFELWTGVKPPVDVMRDALMKRIK